MNIISNDGSNKLNRSRKARVSYKVQRTINASLNAATSTRAVSSNPNFVTRQKIEIIFTKNQAVATSQEAVQNQNEPQLRDENAHNDKSVHGVLNPTYQAGLRRDAVQPDIEAERKKRDEIEAGKSYCSRRFGGATCDD